MISSRFVRHALIVMLMALAFASPPVAQAQVAPELATQLREAEAEVRTIDRQADRRMDDAERTLLRGRLAAARQSALAAAEQLSAQLTLVDARIAELGPKPATPEAPEVSNQRARLAAQHGSLDAAVKRARLLDVEADQLADEIQRKEAEEFGARISQRTASPLTPAFWRAIAESFDGDLARISGFLADGERQARAQGQRRGVWFALLGIVVAALLLGPARRGTLRLGQRYLISDAPGHRLRRSAYAIWLVIVGTLAPLFAAIAIVTGAQLSHLLAPNWAGLTVAFVGAMGFAGFTVTVFGALLMRSQPSWRVAPIEDAVAERLRPLTWILAGITFFTILIDAFNETVKASTVALTVFSAVETACSLVLIAGALIALGRIRAAEVAQDDGASVGSPGLGALSLLLWVVVLVASVAFMIGYIQFSQFLVSMIVWATVLCTSTYLLMNVIDDATTGIFTRGSGLGRTLVRGVGVRGSAIDQFGVLLSGALRLIVVLIALVLLLVPFRAGSGIASSIEQVAGAANGVDVGGVTVSPGTILRGIVVLLVGLALVRGFMSWLERRYLPATDLDGSGRNSVSLIARYIGIALATIWALASLGIGVERIALLLSALSVGIGFGLQAITQNFVSGLILLAERPIKIGDLIKVGADEGDVKRISVRSTEIELADHSTLIVPNSELITKSVLNKTLSNPLGRIQIQFSVQIESDAAVVERILLDAYADEPAVLKTPAPSVFIDSIVDGRTVFNSFAHVAGPRAAYGARSNVFKTLMRRLREEGVEFGTAPQRLEIVSSPEGETALGGSSPPHR